MENIDTTYNDEPVYYCANCLSLGIKSLEYSKICECSVCHSTVIKKSSIYEWEQKYRELYNNEFLNKQ